MIKHGPFDGLLGFSHGAILSAALPGLQANVPKIKFVVIIWGAKFRNPSVVEKAYSSLIQCPSVHFLETPKTISKASGSGSSGSEMHPCGLPVVGIMERDSKISVLIDLESCHIPS
ncbi:uncharacterized protein [Primulina eburnea]|uniref:uncharacterized protein isoform X2 n=1 Tax=Primulina eburnea TaxID=1245227 RepID=UPI003C6BFA4D